MLDKLEGCNERLGNIFLGAVQRILHSTELALTFGGGTESIWHSHAGPSIHCPPPEMHSNQMMMPLSYAQTFVKNKTLSFHVNQ